MQHSRTRVIYDPATDASLKIWLDATDTSTLKDTGGAAITNGATIGTWSSKAGTARNFTQWGANGRPTWQSSGINGLAAAAFTTNQILTTQTNMAEFASMSGITVMAAVKRNSANGLIFTTTMVNSGTGLADIDQCQLNMGPTFTGGGRQARGDSFVTVVAVPAVNTSTVFVETIAFGFSTGHISLYGNGVENIVNQAYHTPGTTDAGDPFAISVGGGAQQTGSAAFWFAEGSIGEVLVYLSELSPDDTVARHDYLCYRWGGGLL